MNADFLNPLVVRELPETNGDTWWMIVEPLKYYSEIMKNVIVLPVGFITNFVSFTPLKNIGQRPAALHDFLTSCMDVSNELAAAVFHEACNSVGVDSLLGDGMAFTVKVVGASHHTNDYILADHLESMTE